jgi:dTDP-4-dehydrorhamnose 3,5-epimerase
MIFAQTPLSGAYLIDIKRIEDERGFFARGFCQNEFTEHGLNPAVAQVNVAFNHRRGTVRGMHFQRAPWAEAKLVRCTRGAIFDVIVDLRPGSATRGRWFGVELTQDNRRMLYVPEDFAHGYQTLADDTEIYYQTSRVYAPQFAAGVRFDDPALAIAWPLPASVVSEQDRNWPEYAPSNPDG